MRQGRFKLAMTLGRSPREHAERVKICKEMGVTGCVTSPDIHGIGRDQYEAAMRQQKEEWAEAGFTIPVYETMTIVPGNHIRRGTEGREEELKNYIAAIAAMGRVGMRASSVSRRMMFLCPQWFSGVVPSCVHSHPRKAMTSGLAGSAI